MPRTKTVVPGRRRRKKVMKAVKGNFQGRRKLFQTAKETRATAPREAGAQTPIDAPDAGAPPEAAPTTELVRQRPTLESTPATQQAAAASQIQTEVTGEQQAGRMAEAAPCER